MNAFGREEVGTVAGTGILLFEEAENTRQGILLTNHHASATLWVALTNDFATEPTISSTQHNIPVPANSIVTIRVGRGVAVWLKTGGTSVPFTAKEVR